jgi:hypothetical protein
MGGLIEVVLRLVESSLELVTGLGGGRLDCLPRLGHTRLEYVEGLRSVFARLGITLGKDLG